MTWRHARWMQWGGLAIALVLLDGWACQSLSDAGDAAGQSTRSVAQCRDAMERIRQLRGRAVVAALPGEELPPMGSAWEAAAAAAGIAKGNVARVTPEPLRRLGDTAYQEQATALTIQAVTLEQLSRFLYTLLSGDPRLQVRSLRLSTPAQQDTGERWTVDLTLAYVVYAPAGAGRRN